MVGRLDLHRFGMGNQLELEHKEIGLRPARKEEKTT